MRAGVVLSKGCVTLFLACVVVWWGWTGSRYAESEYHASVVKQTLRSNPVLSFAASIEAYETFPLPVETRRQVAGSFLAALPHARIQRPAAEIVWLIAQSVSPWDAGGLLSRAGYLVNYGGDLGPVADRLKRVAPWSVETWIVETYRQAFAGNRAGARAAMERARSTGGLDEDIATTLEGVIRSAK